MSANIQIRFGLQIVLVCLYSTPSHYHHCANLSEGIELIKCLSDIFCRVCRERFSPLSIINYVGLYVFSLHISLVMIERIYILCLIIIIKSEVWTIIHCLGSGHETMVSAVCFSIFLWKGATQNCRRYRADTISKVKAEWPWKYRSRSKVITCDTSSDANVPNMEKMQVES